MASLSREHRKLLEKVVAEARKVAEVGAGKALESLAVTEKDAHRSMTAAEKDLRGRLRAHGRQLGDKRNVEKGTQELDHLVAECAYEHWHRMLFARFLAENHLLIELESGVAIAIDEVKELAQAKNEDWVSLAGAYAVRMLPQVFRQDNPVLEVALAPEDRRALEELLASLPLAVFTADDSLGWTYQFWQAEEKDRVNDSGEKIGADELGPVTQLFTEDYMVEFLLHNTLGAWWVGRKHGGSVEAASEEEARVRVALPGVTWTYLRLLRDEETCRWRPAAETFDGWPNSARELTLLDPCMGSGHFLVFALPILAAFRMAEEQLSIPKAIHAVLQENLFGLEIDPRCTQIGAFNLALAAWRRVGHCQLPAMNLACSGLAPNAPEKDWLAIAGSDQKLQRGMERLYRLFQKAAVLGSLINPRAGEGDLLSASFRELQPLLEQVLAKEAGDDAAHEMAVTARGLAKAAWILAGQFTLVATNVPYLGRGKQDELLRDFCDRAYPVARADLATCFFQRSIESCKHGGTCALVTPQSWLFQGSYADLRKLILTEISLNAIGILGPHCFETISGAVVNATLIVATSITPSAQTRFFGIDASQDHAPSEKAKKLRQGGPELLVQSEQRKNPDRRISATQPSSLPTLAEYADVFVGFQNGDTPRWVNLFWEQPDIGRGWDAFHATPERPGLYEGLDAILRWEGGDGELSRSEGCYVKGREAWGRRGVLCRQTQPWPTSLYLGTLYDQSSSVLVPKSASLITSLHCFLRSDDFRNGMLAIANTMKFTNSTFVKVPFDLAHWSQVATAEYPDGLPKPFSSSATQWLFDGQPASSDQPLHVAVARLLGYQWPRQTGSSFPDCPALGPDLLDGQADADGIVCLDSLKGEEPAESRLQKLLKAAFGKEWSGTTQAELLAGTDYKGVSLDDWLRDAFFEQHCELFHHRPFVWHIWDGLRDGFNALVNYHKLAAPDGAGRRTLEKLTFTYLGDWIGRQKAERNAGKEGADARLAAATHLQNELKRILDGEPPYDLFVRWKPLREQAIGWNPDINDGVRMNIRPFMMAKTLKGKSIFRKAPKIKWDKDRGKEPERPKRDFPWFWGWGEGEEPDFMGAREFDGNRWNDLHYSIERKQEARDQHREQRR